MVNSGRGGDTALTLAAHSGNSRSVQILLKAGAKMNHINADGNSALINAASFLKGTESVYQLMRFGADANMVNQASGRSELLSLIIIPNNFRLWFTH